MADGTAEVAVALDIVLFEDSVLDDELGSLGRQYAAAAL